MEQYDSWHSGAGIREQARRVTDWRRERRWEVAVLKGRQQQEMQGQLERHSYLTLMDCMFAPLKVHSLKACV